MGTGRAGPAVLTIAVVVVVQPVPGQRLMTPPKRQQQLQQLRLTDGSIDRPSLPLREAAQGVSRRHETAGPGPEVGISRMALPAELACHSDQPAWVARGSLRAELEALLLDATLPMAGSGPQFGSGRGTSWLQLQLQLHMESLAHHTGVVVGRKLLAVELPNCQLTGKSFPSAIRGQSEAGHNPITDFQEAAQMPWLQRTGVTQSH